MTFGEFLFHKLGRRRDKSEALHDLLVTAKDGLIRTRLMYGSNLSWGPLIRLIKLAKATELIEEVEISPSYWRKKPTNGWKTTKKGLKYAQTIYDNYTLLQEVEK